MSITIGRRLFLAGGATLGAAAFCLPRSAYAAREPQRGGTLTFNFQSDPPNFDPLSNSTSRTLYAIAPCYNSLVMYDPLKPDELIGDIAQGWETSEDGRKITFNLIRNAKFHDGTPLTAADVKFTFDRIRNPPDGVVSVRQGTLEAIEAINQIDDFTVEFLLKRPSPSLLTNLAGGWMVILPKHFVEAGGDLKKEVMGSGPFKFRSYQTGVSVQLERNEDYHIPGRPYLDGITFYIVPDPGTVYSYFRTGQIMVYESLQGEDSRRAEKEFGEDILIQGVPSYGFSSLVFNTAETPWNDVRVRRALAHAIDNQQALKVLRQGDGYLGGLMPAEGHWAIPAPKLAGLPGFAPNRETDIAEARRLLAEAGLPEGFSTTLMTKRGASYEALAIFLIDQLAKVGINARLDLQEDATAYENLTTKKFQLSAWEQTVTADDPDAVFGELYSCEGGRNFSSTCDPEVDRLYQAQSEEMNPEERLRLVQELERAAIAQYGRVILFWRKSFLGQSRSVHDLLRHPQMDNNRRMQNVWIS